MCTYQVVGLMEVVVHCSTMFTSKGLASASRSVQECGHALEVFR